MAESYIEKPYAKNFIEHLRSSNIPVEAGLSEAEFSAVESSFSFTFPPDLRSLLREGLPVGPGFPNWRSSSKQQLHIFANLPIAAIYRGVSRNEFWVESWGDRPPNIDLAVKLAQGFLKKAPILVPIYRGFYIPSSPCMAGNPLFHVNGVGVISLCSFDLAGFFQRVEFGLAGGGEEVSRRPRLSDFLAAPARRIEFWTEVAERGGSAAARGWWSGELGLCLEEVCWRLRGGGWKEDDVREMMMMDGCDEELDHEDCDDSDEVMDEECLRWRVRVLSNRLLRAGWSTEDVVDSLGHPLDCHQNEVSDWDLCFDFHYTPT